MKYWKLEQTVDATSFLNNASMNVSLCLAQKNTHKQQRQHEFVHLYSQFHMAFILYFWRFYSIIFFLYLNCDSHYLYCQLNKTKNTDKWIVVIFNNAMHFDCMINIMIFCLKKEILFSYEVKITKTETNKN